MVLVEGLYPPRVDASPEHRGATGNDCNMLVATGGRQRSEAEMRALLERAGLALERVVSTAMTPMIVARPSR